MTVSNKTMERIMRQDSNLSPYDGFRIGGIGKVLNQIGLNQRKQHIIYKVSSGEFAIPIEFTGNVMEMQLIPKEEILEELSRLREEVAVTMKWIHIGTIEVVIKATFKEGIDSEIHLSIMDRRINNLRDGCLGTMIGNLYAGKLMFDIHPRIAYNLADQDFSRVLTLHQDFKRKDLMKEGNRPYSITYRIAYALSNTHHSDLFLRKSISKFPEFSRNLLRKGFFTENPNTQYRNQKAKIMIGGAFGTPWFRVKTPPIYFHDTGADILLVLRREKAFNRIMPINFRSKRGNRDLSIESFRQQGLIDRDSLYEESEEIKNLREALVELKTMDISEESILSLENVKRLIQRNFSELKQVCNNLPKLAIPQDEDELVVYTDANDYRWAAVLMKKTTTGEEPCRYTGGLFTEQQAQVWHINEKEFFAVWKAFKKWPLFLLAKEFTLKVDNTNVKAFLKNKLESKIEKAQMEGAEANSVMLRLRHLRENLEEPDREFGRLAVNAQVAGQVQRADLDKVQTNIRSSLVASTALWNALLEPIRKASPSVMTRELREQGSKPALRVQGSRPVAADSSTACTRPSSDSGEKATDESQGVKTSDDSSQPSTSGVKEGEISLRPMTGTSKTNTNELSSSSSSAWQVWMMEGSKPEEVREWYEFGALASVHTMSPSFPEISKLPEWISGAVYDSWQNNPHLKRGDILELKFISTAPEMAGKGSHPAFHFIKLQRPDMVAFKRIKATTKEAPLVSAISEDDISTRRAWGLWVCLTEMDKVKYPFKIFSNKVNGSFLLNSMTGKSTEFAESMFEKKRMLIWRTSYLQLSRQG
ncbi:movement protein [Sesamum angolense]|uniref:Movement protein n=1 Tax=Sesamum angolense TaxID=2727404 RepID=A0AAE1XDT3_9LAMI|nr:movement protein [Sesamum angolense]